ncbi:hypothetical protein C9I49_13270 [Pseudomonas prosekii]|uniref:Uncharacterized protein n=1 Tax=Pseudomonas prosekii TaxID=1148509 RepID=A0A2U2D813_9PSED|nr:hypothetical protein C9I49_13270 [Pseudomonas prosekii]
MPSAASTEKLGPNSHREQAHSYIGFAASAAAAVNHNPCGSELARDGIGSRTDDVGADMAIASKLAPTFGLW